MNTTDGFVVFEMIGGAADYRFVGQALPMGAIPREAWTWCDGEWSRVALHSYEDGRFDSVAADAVIEAASFG